MVTRRPATLTVRWGTMDEASAYREQSRTSWQSAAAAWERERAAVSRAAARATPWLTGHAELQPGQTVLELACGTGETGISAAAMVGPQGRVIETDQAPAMVEAALRSAADRGLDNVEARVMDAERLELPDASVDAVVCRWGLMLMADPAACLAEVLRVLRPGGRLAAVVWGPPEDNPWPAVVLGVLIEEGLIQPAGPDSGPGLFALADEARLRDLVAGAGLAGAVVDRIPANWEYADADEYWRVQTTLSTAAARTLAPLDDDRLARIRRRVDERLAPFRTADGLVLPGVSLGVAAHRPL
jgi:SAM-dependent methyltransferase